jgi:hypothetical protein
VIQPSEPRIAREMRKANCDRATALDRIAARRARLLDIRINGGKGEGNPWGPISKLMRRYRDWMS